MTLVLTIIAFIAAILLILGFWISNIYIKTIGFILAFLIIFIVVYFLFLIPPENIKKRWTKWK